MPWLARNDVTSVGSVIVRCSSGMRIRLMTFPYHLKQEFQCLHVSFCIGQRASPCVEPVPAQEKPVDGRVVAEQVPHYAPKARHVLIVLDDRHPLAMGVRGDAIQSLQHLQVLDGDTTSRGMTLREH